MSKFTNFIAASVVATTAASAAFADPGHPCNPGTVRAGDFCVPVEEVAEVVDAAIQSNPSSLSPNVIAAIVALGLGYLLIDSGGNTNGAS